MCIYYFSLKLGKEPPLEGMIAQMNCTITSNQLWCSLTRSLLTPLIPKGKCFLDLSHSKCNFCVTKSIESCDI